MISLLASIVFAAPFRVGVFVGNNEGATGEQPLVFARADARKMKDLFQQYGDLDHAVLIEDGSRNQVAKAMHDATDRILQAKARSDETTLVFFYSGHGDAQSLHLGTSHLPHEQLRQWLDDSGADVRLAFLDACQSGSALRTKGSKRGPDMAFDIAVERTTGTAILTSSAATELSQESTEVGGGFFTHYLHSALTGAGDANRDGTVTLTEAYAFVHRETSFSTKTSSVSQTPSFDFDLVGSGDVSVTELHTTDSSIRFLGDIEGKLSIWDESRKRYVAEVDGETASMVAIRPGVYFVHRRMPGWVFEAKYSVRKGETAAVHQQDFSAVQYDRTASKGDLDRQVRRSKIPDASIGLVLAARSFSDKSYFSSAGAVGVQLKFLGIKRLYTSFGFTFSSGNGTLQFEGIDPINLNVTTTVSGASIGFATKKTLFRFGAGARGAVFTLNRNFADFSEANQTHIAVAPGFEAWGGVHHGRFSLDLQLQVHILLTHFDEEAFPASSDLGFVAGYRF